MDLKQFVSISLQQIVAGVAEAQKADHGGEVNPTIWRTGDAGKLKIVESNTGNWIHMVDFDIAVTVGESTGTQGGIGLVVGPVALGSRGQSNAETSSVSRIRFQVPVSWPTPPPKSGA